MSVSNEEWLAKLLNDKTATVTAIREYASMLMKDDVKLSSRAIGSTIQNMLTGAAHRTPGSMAADIRVEDATEPVFFTVDELRKLKNFLQELP